jgi:hypothetical protein
VILRRGLGCSPPSEAGLQRRLQGPVADGDRVRNHRRENPALTLGAYELRFPVNCIGSLIRDVLHRILGFSHRRLSKGLNRSRDSLLRHSGGRSVSRLTHDVRHHHHRDRRDHQIRWCWRTIEDNN